MNSLIIELKQLTLPETPHINLHKCKQMEEKLQKWDVNFQLNSGQFL